jgi:hypothetical protein
MLTDFYSTTGFQNTLTMLFSYICGYIARKLKNKINCAECFSQLVDENSVSKLISRKDQGGLIKPSVSVIEICKIAEMIFKSNNNFAGNVLLRLSYLTKKYIDINNYFPALNVHILDQDPLNNHLLQLLNLILKYYFTIRIHHKHMQINEVKKRIRHQYSKLILFQHQ